MDAALPCIFSTGELCHHSLVVMPGTGHAGEREFPWPTDLHCADVITTNGEASSRCPPLLLNILHLSSSIFSGGHEDLGMCVARTLRSERHSNTAGEEKRDYKNHRLHCHLRCLLIQ